MKRILILIICCMFFSFTIKSDFKDGFSDGYCEGWKDVKGQMAICPITPVAPIPKINQNTYKGGYNAGFKKGRKKAKE
jgi:hypothetical protein